MPLAIIGFVFLAGVLIFYLLNTSSGSTNNDDHYKGHDDNDFNIDNSEDKDNTIVFPSDVEKAKKKRHIGK